MNYEEIMYNLLSYIIYKMYQLYDNFNGALNQFNMVQEQYIDFIDKSKIFQEKRDEYINNTAECENIKRMHFLKLENNFKLYQNIIMANIKLLEKPFTDLNNIVNSLNSLYTNYFKMINAMKKHKLVKLKELLTLEEICFKSYNEFLDYLYMINNVNKIMDELTKYVNTSHVYYHDDKLDDDQFRK